MPLGFDAKHRRQRLSKCCIAADSDALIHGSVWELKKVGAMSATKDMTGSISVYGWMNAKNSFGDKPLASTSLDMPG